MHTSSRAFPVATGAAHITSYLGGDYRQCHNLTVRMRNGCASFGAVVLEEGDVAHAPILRQFAEALVHRAHSRGGLMRLHA